MWVNVISDSTTPIQFFGLVAEQAREEKKKKKKKAVARDSRPLPKYVSDHNITRNGHVNALSGR